MTAAVFLTVLGGLVGLEWLLRNVFALHVWRRVFHLTPESPPWPREESPPRVSVIVPARDEERNIGPCLDSLLQQDYPNLDVLVVDDRSRDRTADIVASKARRDGRIRLLRVTELPDGWAGKTHALQQGAEAADGEYLCFFDADVRLTHPRTLSVAMEHVRARAADLLSLLPTMQYGGFWEAFLLPICAGVLVVWFRPERVNDPAKKTAFANGQFLLVRREAYRAVGEHRALRESIIEDMDLARRLKSAGWRIFVVPSRGLLSVRMYTSLADLRRGWLRIFLGCFPSAGRLLAAVGVLWGRGLVPFLQTGVGWAMTIAGREPLSAWLVCAAVGTVGLAAELLMTVRYYRAAGTRGALGLLYPLGCAWTGGLILHALFRRLAGGKVVWKGRQYRADRAGG